MIADVRNRNPRDSTDAHIMARMSAPRMAAPANIIQLKVALRGVRPPVWRRLLMPGTMTLGQLHTAIQAAMGVAFEKSELAVKGKSCPACTGGKRKCPPEDCGGAWGYAHLLAILADPSHPEHADQIEWIGEDFDPNAFDCEHANTVLAAQFKKK